MKLTPVQDNIIIKIPVVEKEQVTKSGIVITGAAAQQDLPEKGIVVAVGPGRLLSNGILVESKIEVGTEVIFSKFAGIKISDNEEEFLIVKENDILAIVGQ